MCSASQKVALVVPCFNEAGRLRVEPFRAFGASNPLLFVDDGSTDGTLDLLRREVVPPCEVMRLERNAGKGEAVRAGMLHLAASESARDAEWIGFWDADLATPLEAVHDLTTFAETFYPGESDAVIGCRLNRMGGRIVRGATRHYLGRVFATVARFPTGLVVYDSQCGAKLFRRSSVPALFGEPFVSRWIFDLEILLRMERAGLRAVECPLRSWEDHPRSHLHPLRTSLRVLLDLAQIRTRYRR